MLRRWVADVSARGRGRRGRRLLRLLGALAILVCGDAALPRLLRGDEDPARFLEEYRASTSILAQKLANVQVTWNPTPDEDGPEARQFKAPRNVKLFSRAGRLKLWKIHRFPNYFESVVLTSEKSSFELRRTSPQGSFYIASTPLPPTDSQTYDRLRDRVALAPIALGQARIHNLINTPEFQFQKVTRDSQGLVTASFTHPGRRVGDAIVTTSGWMRLNPKLMFAVTDYEWTLESTINGRPVQMKEKCNTLYANTEGFPVPKEIHVEHPTPKGSPRGDHFYITQWTTDAPPLDDFSLEKYGLGDAED